MVLQCLASRVLSPPGKCTVRVRTAYHHVSRNGWQEKDWVPGGPSTTTCILNLLGCSCSILMSLAFGKQFSQVCAALACAPPWTAYSLKICPDSRLIFQESQVGKQNVESCLALETHPRLCLCFRRVHKIWFDPRTFTRHGPYSLTIFRIADSKFPGNSPRTW